MWYYNYRLSYWDEGKYMVSGHVYASDFTDACSKLEEYYGKNIENVTLSCSDCEGPVFEETEKDLLDEIEFEELLDEEDVFLENEDEY